jgi:hypothetical protein
MHRVVHGVEERRRRGEEEEKRERKERRGRRRREASKVNARTKHLLLELRACVLAGI